MPVAASPIGYCLRLLKTRLRSRAELDAAMVRRKIPDEQRQAVLEQLVEARLVDDRQFARAWVHSRDRLAPRGEVVLRQELMQKGLEKWLIEEVLGERREISEDQPSDFELARDLIERKSRQFSHLAPDVRRRRQSALLQRRGFSYGVIKRILDT